MGKAWPWGATLLVGLMTAGSGAVADDQWIRETGDILQIALPVIGGGATFFTNPDPDQMWDRQGTKQFVYSFGAAWSTTYLLKIVSSKARPNGDNRTSFPSGHTMAAFSGAAFIDGRYGKALGIPAYLLAGFTGYSRIISGWHYQDDVIAGASIAMMSSWHFVTPQRGKVSILPTVGAEGYGIQVSLGGGGDEPDPETQARPRRAGYEFAFGPAFAVSNICGSKGGSHFQLTDLEGNNDPTTTADVSIIVPVSERGRIIGSYGPFEAKDKGSFAYDVDFGGVSFPAGTALESAWRYYDLRFRYDFQVLDNSTWGVRIGGGVATYYSYTALQTANGETGSVLDDSASYPYGHLALDYKFCDRFSLTLVAEGLSFSDEWYQDTGAKVTYRAARAWDLTLGYNYSVSEIDSEVYFNKITYSTPSLSVTRYW